jgi:hypothetical protein
LVREAKKAQRRGDLPPPEYHGMSASEKWRHRMKANAGEASPLYDPKAGRN